MSDRKEIQNLYYQTSLNYVSYWFDYLNKHSSNHQKLELEIENILNALQKASNYANTENNEYERLIDAIHRVYPYCESRGLYEQIERFLIDIQPWIEEGQRTPEYIKNLALMGRISIRKEDFNKATQYFMSGIGLAKKYNNTRLQSELWVELGSLKTTLGDERNEAKEHLVYALKLADRLDDPNLQCFIQMELCRLLYRKGVLDEAEKYCQLALLLAYQLESEHRITGLLIYQGAIEEGNGQNEKAFVTWQKGLELAREVRDLERIGYFLANLGMMANQLGEHDAAISYLREGVNLARQLGNSQLLSHQLMDQALLFSKKGEHKNALTKMTEGVDIAREIKAAPLLTYNLLKKGAYQIKQKDNNGALDTFIECSSLIESLDEEEKSNPAYTRKLADAYWGMARAIYSLGQPRKARMYSEKSIRYYQLLNDAKAEEIKAWLMEIDLSV